VPELTLGLAGSRKSINPTAGVRELEKLAPDALVEHLQELTGRSEAALRSALSKPVDEDHFHRILIACDNDRKTADRVRPFAHLLRKDSWGDPLIYPKDAFIVGMSAGRRETGSHYTPKALTEPIVQHTLEPLVYFGPAEGLPQDKWKLKSPGDLLGLKICDMAMGSAAFLVQTCRWLGDRLIESWDIAEKNGKVISIEGEVLNEAGRSELLPHDKGERILIARRLIASRCLYGVDINPMAVELAKLSLWLITLMKGRPFGFLDHALKCGDSLLGVSSVQQIENFSLRPGDRQVTFATANLFRYVEEASAKRRALEQLPSNDHTQIESKNRLHAEAEAATAKVKALADMLLAFEMRGLDGDAYEDGREAEATNVLRLMKHEADAGIETSNPKSELARVSSNALGGHHSFHWAVEFPEVFARGGFDAFVGNPPFLGGNRVSRFFGDHYRDLLDRLMPESNSNANLCARFHLKSFDYLNSLGVYGLLSTDRIAEGETRVGGLDLIVNRGGKIFLAETSRPWPGGAAVRYAIVCVSKTESGLKCALDGVQVERIGAGLSAESDFAREPQPLARSWGTSYVGCGIHGAGFMLGEAEAERLLANQMNSFVVRPFLIARDLNYIPGSTPQRWIINFEDRSLEEASKFDDCMAIVRERVKPYRETVKRDNYRDKWWQFGERRPGLSRAVLKHKHVLACAMTTVEFKFEWLPSDWVFDQTTVVVIPESRSCFSVLESALHKAWATELGSGFGSGGAPRYNPSRCFSTFPFPTITPSRDDQTLQCIGEAFHLHRCNVIKDRNEGLTAIYGLMHNGGEKSADIARLRALHVEMDQAVAAAYGWTDLDLGHGFHATKQGERYTLSEPARRTVLDRLLALNHQRYEEEVKAGLHDKKKTKGKSGLTKTDDAQKELF